MNNDRIFSSVLFALLVFHWVTDRDTATTVTAYYGAIPGFSTPNIVIYGADVSTQKVYSVSRDASPGKIDDAGELSNCTVLDARNWSCKDGDGTLFPVSFTRSIDGRVEVTDSKNFIPPESWLAWKSARILGSQIASLWGAS